MSLTMKIKTLTPLWTGGIDGTMDRIHETGIIGSLRWWYEAIVRGLGGKACDPTGDKCSFSAKAYRESKATDERQRLRDAGLCDVCQIFGATGWRRRFRLEVEEHAISNANVSHIVKADRIYQKGKNTRQPTWYFPHPPKQGNIVLRFQSLSYDFPLNVIAGLLQFVANWGSIGARPQMGFGVLEISDGQADTKPLYKWLSALVGSNKYPTHPSLRNIFFARITPKNGSFSEVDTFNLKYDLRRLFASEKDLRHFIMGTVKGNRIATKVKISRPYNNGQEMRVWGWIPEQVDEYEKTCGRESIVSTIHAHLSTNYTLQVWREMSSSRDTVMPHNDDAQVFLRSLLGLREDHNEA